MCSCKALCLPQQNGYLTVVISSTAYVGGFQRSNAYRRRFAQGDQSIFLAVVGIFYSQGMVTGRQAVEYPGGSKAPPSRAYRKHSGSAAGSDFYLTVTFTTATGHISQGYRGEGDLRQVLQGSPLYP